MRQAARLDPARPHSDPGNLGFGGHVSVWDSQTIYDQLVGARPDVFD